MELLTVESYKVRQAQSLGGRHRVASGGGAKEAEAKANREREIRGGGEKEPATERDQGTERRASTPNRGLHRAINLEGYKKIVTCTHPPSMKDKIRNPTPRSSLQT